MLLYWSRFEKYQGAHMQPRELHDKSIIVRKWVSRRYCKDPFGNFCQVIREGIDERTKTIWVLLYFTNFMVWQQHLLERVQS